MKKDEKQKVLMKAIDEAVDVLKRGGIAAAATETFFALMADINRQQAIARIRKLKKLDEHAPLLIIVPSLKDVAGLCESVSHYARQLAEKYWPGPLTMIFRARTTFPPYLLGPFGTVAVRIPGECDAAEILRRMGRPLTATSCNLHGEAPAVSGRMAQEMFKGKINVIVPGSSPGGLPSTIVDTTVNPPVIRRRGILNIEGKYLRK
jgi:L-threonylcarbamoyladenylate synthase